MSENSKKGPLIQKKAKSSKLERPKPVLVNNQNDFKFKNDQPNQKQAAVSPFAKEDVVPTPPAKKKPMSPAIEKKVTAPRKAKSVVGKNNNVKSIKVPHDLHIQIGVLGKFMDENKTYAIISELVEYYTKNELTDRQQKQFEYMTEFFNDTEE